MLCAVINCKMCNNKKQNVANNIGFHAFPKCLSLLKQWIHFCGRKDKFNVKTARICGQHFIADDYENNLQFEMGFCHHRILKSSAVPSIRFIEDSSVLKESNRTKRIQTRNTKKEINILIKENCDPELDFEKTNDMDIEEHFTDNEKYVQTEYNYLNILEEEIKNLRNDNDDLKECVSKMEKEIEDLKILLQKSNFEKNNIEDTLSKIFTSGQLRKLKEPGYKKLNWKESDIAQSMTLYSASQRGYKLLKKRGFPLPSIRTLQRWSQKVDVLPGILQPKRSSKKR